MPSDQAYIRQAYIRSSSISGAVSATLAMAHTTPGTVSISSAAVSASTPAGSCSR
ncbi:MAG: hypothetical protein R2755_00570 [Acidimicrobiales bacterium]